MPVETTPRKAPARKKPVADKRKPEDVVTAVTVSGAERTPANLPSSFQALKPDELRYAADELFAVDSDGTPEEIIERLTESGVTWAMYAKAMKLPGADELPDETPDFPEPITEWDEAEEEEEVSDVITAPAIAKLPEGKYLIKFIGQNWYFERGRYTFSTDQPYALMNARDAQAALVEEPTKFRQAMPSELEEFYQ